MNERKHELKAKALLNVVSDLSEKIVDAINAELSSVDPVTAVKVERGEIAEPDYFDEFKDIRHTLVKFLAYHKGAISIWCREEDYHALGSIEILEQYDD